ncbi:hypothetical protein ACH2FV_19440 (plasmid) [Bacillus safensis subsp. safensis]|uniref:hypothetical protein n=1 Tax=Bacillus safensis TaxID=561879 RepID=UPI0037BF1B1C
MSEVNASIVLGGDLDNLGRLVGGRLDYPFMPRKTLPYIEGLQMTLPGVVETFDLKYTPQQDIELCSIAVGANRYHPTDSWSVFVGEEEELNYICKNIYTKEVPEGIQLMAVKLIKAGETITFRFDNRGGKSKYVWINYQGLRGPEVNAEGR